MQDRKAHLQWCKDRSNELADRNEIMDSFASFQSDMSKHPETENHKALEMGTMLLLGGNLQTKEQIKNWINGFN